MFQVEDFINSASTTPLSSVPVQFLVEVVGPPACPTQPDVYELSTKTCIPVQVGTPFSTRIYATNYCGPTVNITDIATLSFPGIVQGNLVRQNWTTYYKTVTWTPTSSQVGYQVMCAMATDR